MRTIKVFKTNEVKDINVNRIINNIIEEAEVKLLNIEIEKLNWIYINNKLIYILLDDYIVYDPIGNEIYDENYYLEGIDLLLCKMFQ